MAASERISCELEALWSQSQIDSVASLINSKYQMGDVTQGLPLISEALETYIELKGKDKSPNFESSVRRSVTYLIDALGDKPIDLYSRKDALFMRDAFVSRNLSVASIKRNFNNINALTGLVCKELGYPASATFRGLFFREAGVQNQRLPVPDMLREFLQKECKATDDEARWLLALISDTGMRLSEAIGLAREDISLAGKVPYITIQPHPWRRLKTIDSKRRIPLIGSALWAAQRLIDSHKSTFAFPSFCNGKLIKSNSVSARLNKWLKLRIGDEYVIHSFRHSLRDRLRSVDCPSEVADAIKHSQKLSNESGVQGFLLPLMLWAYAHPGRLQTRLFRV